jgi:hypothetical protein
VTQALPAPIVQKITAILPRLSSPFDGEVVASAKAIGRTLESAGFDWHDLAARISRPLLEARADRGEQSPPTWSSIHPDDRPGFLQWLLDEAKLSPWERNFLVNVRRYWCSLSEKQIAVIDKIIRRCMERGLRV